MSRPYPTVIAATIRESESRTASLWALECAIRRDRGRMDAERLNATLKAMEESGRLVKVTGETGPAKVWTLGKGRR